MTDKLSRGLVETWASDPIDNKVTVLARELLEAWDKIDRLTGELESAEDTLSAKMAELYKTRGDRNAANKRAEKAEANLIAALREARQRGAEMAACAAQTSRG